MHLLRSFYKKAKHWCNTFNDEVPGASLGFTRICFGLLMLADLQEERGMSIADERFGDPLECRFPLFELLKPLRLQYMVLLYAAMMCALVCVVLGAAYKTALFIYTVIYWFIYLGDKTRWNNHSYLYGLISIILLNCSADDCLSWVAPSVSGTVPRWNYLFLRLQIFLVYFYAGIKKFDPDWLGGYSMQGLGHHWVWTPLRVFFPVHLVEHLVIHVSGFLFDLLVGFIILWKPLRPLGAVLTVMFNGLNSRMFSIGMFPYVMIAMVPLFFDYDWPLELMRGRSTQIERCTTKKSKYQPAKRRVALKTKIFIAIFIAAQIVLPFVTPRLFPGYNTWTGGLYGHQWNMMVHNWNHGQIRISVKDRTNGNMMYIDHKKLTARGRWYQQADMIWQFARCTQRRLKDELNLTDIEIYADVWMSLNSRFMQRVFDPRVNLIRAKWTPFRRPSWIFDVQRDFDHLRPIIMTAASSQAHSMRATHTEFLLDFPGLNVTNHIPLDLEGVYLTVLQGESMLRIGNYERLLIQGDRAMIPSGRIHHISNVGSRISLMMYAYLNRTEDVPRPMSETNSSTATKGIERHIKMWIESFALVAWAVGEIFSDAAGLVSK